MKINEFQIIFIGGIHGVGKSMFSEKISNFLKIPCLSASKLITEQRKAPAAVNKRVQSVEENQNALITAIELSSIKTRQIFLDGHFCVFDSSDLIRKILLETFRMLSPSAVVLLTDEVEHIRQRLENREGRKFSQELLADLQKVELEHASEVCRVLNIPMCVAEATQHDNAQEFVATRFNNPT